MITGTDVNRGTPGGSLLRTYEARRSARQVRVRGSHPHLGGLLLALTAEPDTTLNFRRGARAEAAVAQYLRGGCGPDVELLFNRRLSSQGRDGDIDVLAVTPNGVHVVDVKRYRRASVRVRTAGGVHRPISEELVIGGRDRTRLLDSLDRQRDAVRWLLDGFPGGAEVPLRLAMCFVDADLPLFTQHVHGVALLGKKQVLRRLNDPGPIGPDTRDALLRHLAQHLPAA